MVKQKRPKVIHTVKDNVKAGVGKIGKKEDQKIRINFKDPGASIIPEEDECDMELNEPANDSPNFNNKAHGTKKFAERWTNILPNLGTVEYDHIQPTIGALPVSLQMLKHSCIPFGFIVKPFAGLGNGTTNQIVCFRDCQGPPKCCKCGAYLSSCQCQICKQENNAFELEGVKEFQPFYEFDTTPESITPRMPAFLFLIECVSTCSNSGQMQLLDNHILDILDFLPKDSPVGFMTYYSSSEIGYCILTDDYKVCREPEDEEFDSILSSLIASRSSITASVKRLFKNEALQTKDPNEEYQLSTVIASGVNVLEALGTKGKLLVFHSSKTAPSLMSNYVEEKCIDVGVSVDFLIFNDDKNWEIDDISHLSIATGGQVYRYLDAKDSTCEEQFLLEMKANLSEILCFGASFQMIVPPGMNLGAEKEMKMGTISARTAVNIEMAYMEGVDHSMNMQTVFTFTSMKGENKTVVRNYALNTCDNLEEFYASCNPEAIFCYLIKQHLDNRDCSILILQRMTEILQKCPKASLRWDNLQLLTNRFLRIQNKSFSEGAYEMHFINSFLRTKGVAEIIQYFNPKLFPLCGPDTPSQSQRSNPSSIPCSEDNLKETGAYVLANGLDVILCIGNKGRLLDLFGTENIASITSGNIMDKLINPNSDASKTLRSLLPRLLDETLGFKKVVFLNPGSNYLKKFLITEQDYHLSGLGATEHEVEQDVEQEVEQEVEMPPIDHVSDSNASSPPKREFRFVSAIKALYKDYLEDSGIPWTEEEKVRILKRVPNQMECETEPISEVTLVARLCVKQIGENLDGVFTKSGESINCGEKFQIVGSFKPTTTIDPDLLTGVYPCMLKKTNDNKFSLLERLDISTSHWTHCVRNAISDDLINALIVQEGEDLFLKTTCSIPGDTEIVAGYSEEYMDDIITPFFTNSPLPPMSANDNLRTLHESSKQSIPHVHSFGDPEDDNEQKEDVYGQDDELQGLEDFDFRKPPKRWQDYITQKRLFPRFKIRESEESRALEGEFFAYLDELKLGKNPPCKALINGKFVPYHLIARVQTIRPTIKMMKAKFESFIKFIQYKGYHFSGLTKVIPPKHFMEDGVLGFEKLYGDPQQFKWDNGHDLNFSPYIQTPSEKSKDWLAQLSFQYQPTTIYNVQKWYEYNLKCGKEMYCLNRNDPTNIVNYYHPTELMKDLKKSLTLCRQYCKDIPETMFGPGQPNSEWDMANLPTFYRTGGNWTGDDGDGLIRPYLYFAMFGSAFSWHVEDFSAWSLNYLHYGDPKIWNGISYLYYYKWLHVQRYLYDLHLRYRYEKARHCNWFPLHKQLVIDQETLANMGIPSAMVVQEPGTFIITHDSSPHCGQSTGFSCSDAVNFALHTPRWPLVAIFNPKCPQIEDGCPFGDNTSKPLDPWVEAHFKSNLNVQGYEFAKYNATEIGIKGYNPNAFPFGKQRTVAVGRNNPIEKYPIKQLELETIDIGNSFRGILKSEEYLQELLNFNHEQSLKDLVARDKIVKIAH